MNTLLIIMLSALPITYAVTYIVHCFKKRKIGAALGTGFLTLLTVLTCVILGLIY